MEGRPFPCRFCFVSIVLLMIVSTASPVRSGDSVPVARIYSDTVYRSEVKPADESISEARKTRSDTEYRNWFRKQSYENFMAILWDRLKQRFLREHDLRATSDDIAAYVNHLRHSQVKEINEQKRKLARLRQTISADTVSDDSDSRLKKKITDLKSEISQAQKQLKQWNPDNPIMKRIAVKRIEQWAFRKALFKKYGGNLYFQQAGLEPLDAMETYLRTRLESGDIRFMKPEYRQAIDNFYSYVDSFRKHSDGLGSEARKTFMKPPWER